MAVLQVIHGCKDADVISLTPFLSSGIGFGVAKAVLPLGARVVLSSRSSQKVKDAIQRLEPLTATGGGFVEGFTLDGLEEANVTAFFNKVGAFDHLIYTAGGMSRFLV